MLVILRQKATLFISFLAFQILNAESFYEPSQDLGAEFLLFRTGVANSKIDAGEIKKKNRRSFIHKKDEYTLYVSATRGLVIDTGYPILAGVYGDLGVSSNLFYGFGVEAGLHFLNSKLTAHFGAGYNNQREIFDRSKKALFVSGFVFNTGIHYSILKDSGLDFTIRKGFAYEINDSSYALFYNKPKLSNITYILTFSFYNFNL